MHSEAINLCALPVGDHSAGSGFAWASHAAEEPVTMATVMGGTFGGSYEAAGEWMKQRSQQGAKAFVMLLTTGTGAEDFLENLDPEVRQLPMVGGAAARHGDHPGFVFPPAGDLAVLSIEEGEWESSAVVSHIPTGPEIQIVGDNPRSFSQFLVEGKILCAADHLASLRDTYGLAPDDWDRLALAEEEGVLFHLSDAGNGEIRCGANLPASKKVRAAVFDSEMGTANILNAVSRGSLVFGCAGLHGLFGTERPWESVAPASYLFGELAATESGPRFGNLMFSILRKIA